MLAVYALGGLDDEVCEAVKRHLVGCAVEMDELVQVRTGLDLYRWNRPPAGVPFDHDSQSTLTK